MIIKFNLDVFDYVIVMIEEEFLKVVEIIGYLCVVKICWGGYDGKG